MLKQYFLAAFIFLPIILITSCGTDDSMPTAFMNPNTTAPVLYLPRADTTLDLQYNGPVHFQAGGKCSNFSHFNIYFGGDSTFVAGLTLMPHDTLVNTVQYTAAYFDTTKAYFFVRACSYDTAGHPSPFTNTIKVHVNRIP